MKNPFDIRIPLPEEAEEIQKIAKKSWQYTYRDIFSQEEIENFIQKAYNPDNLRKDILKLPTSLYSYLVLEDRNTEQLVGFGHIGYERAWEIDMTANSMLVEEQKTERGIFLFRIYLHPDYIGKGLGGKLLIKLEEFVTAENRDRYGLYVHKDNDVGISFYQKMGFDHVSEKDKIDDEELFYQKMIK